MDWSSIIDPKLLGECSSIAAVSPNQNVAEHDKPPDTSEDLRKGSSGGHEGVGNRLIGSQHDVRQDHKTNSSAEEEQTCKENNDIVQDGSRLNTHAVKDEDVLRLPSNSHIALPIASREQQQRSRTRAGDRNALLKKALGLSSGKRTISSAVKQLDFIHQEARCRFEALRGLLRRFEPAGRTERLWVSTSSTLLELVRVLLRSLWTSVGLRVVERLVQSWRDAWFEIDSICRWLLCFQATEARDHTEVARNVKTLRNKLQAARRKLQSLIPDLKGFLTRQMEARSV